MKSNIKKIIIAFPVLLAAIAIIYLIVSSLNDNQKVITGLVEISSVDVSSKIPGRIDSIFVKEGDTVIKGQILAKLQSKEIDAKVEQAKGQLEAAKYKYEMALNGARPEEKEAVEKLYLQAKHQYELAEKTWNRMYNLYQDSVISQQEKDVYEFQYKAAMEQMLAAKAKYDMVEKGARYEEIEMAKGIYYQAENGLNEALAYQDEIYIKCPINGELQKKIVDAGEILSAGYPVFTILDPSDVWVTLQIKETDMSKIKKGNLYKGKVTALGNKEYTFEVTYIAEMGDFANWRPTNQKGEFDVKTFEVRLRSKEKLDGLRPGMTVNIQI